MSSTGTDLSDMVPVTKDLNPLFQQCMAAIRAAQTKKPKRGLILPKCWDLEEEFEKYRFALLPYGMLFPIRWSRFQNWLFLKVGFCGGQLSIWGLKLQRLSEWIRL